MWPYNTINGDPLILTGPSANSFGDPSLCCGGSYGGLVCTDCTQVGYNHNVATSQPMCSDNTLCTAPTMPTPSSYIQISPPPNSNGYSTFRMTNLNAGSGFYNSGNGFFPTITMAYITTTQVYALPAPSSPYNFDLMQGTSNNITYDWFTDSNGGNLSSNPGDGTFTITYTYNMSAYNANNDCNIADIIITDSVSVIYGCMDDTSPSYNPNATVHNFSC